jgi:Ras family protein
MHLGFKQYLISLTIFKGAESVPIMIVGNKRDIKPELRVVSAAEGQKLGVDLKCGWVETSARSGENVASAFELMIAEMEKSQEPDKPAGGGKCAVM